MHDLLTGQKDQETSIRQLELALADMENCGKTYKNLAGSFFLLYM